MIENSEEGVFCIAIGAFDPIQTLLPPGYYNVFKELPLDFKAEIERRLVALGADPQSRFVGEGKQDESRSFTCYRFWNIPPVSK